MGAPCPRFFKLQAYINSISVGIGLNDSGLLNRIRNMTKWRDQQFLYSLEEIGGQQEVISLKMITKTVAGFNGCEEKSILHAKRGRGEKILPRWIAMR
jgi:hypothetical protein